LTGRAGIAEKDLENFDEIVIDLYSNVGTFAYGAIAHKCHWIGFDGRPNEMREALTTVTGFILKFC
jgi:tRNA/tmRNA/rRNA uracil-C5-methylase (TrmA/RlmC/RlmD family)